MISILILVIVLVAVILVLKNNSPEGKKKREQKQAEEKAKQEAANLLIETSQQAAMIAKSITDPLSDPNSAFCNFLRLNGAFMTLRVTSKRVYFELGSTDKRVSDELNHDEQGNLLLEKRNIEVITFHDVDWADLPNPYMVNALWSFLMRKIEELPAYTIKSTSGESRIFYTPQKASW